MKPAIVTLSFDDGAPEDLEVATLLKKHELAATFYIPITNIEGRPTLSTEQIVLLSEMDFEIGAHGYHHHYLDRIPAAGVYEEIKNGKDRLEQILEQAVTSFCYPGGRTPVVAVNAVRKLGFRYARTIRECRFSVEDPLLAPTTNPIGWHCRRHYAKEALLSGNAHYWIYFQKHRLWAMDWLDYSLANLKYAIMKGGICHFWGHSFEIHRDNEWDRLEMLFSQIKALQNQGQVVTQVNSRSFHGA